MHEIFSKVFNVRFTKIKIFWKIIMTSGEERKNTIFDILMTSLNFSKYFFHFKSFQFLFEIFVQNIIDVILSNLR